MARKPKLGLVKNEAGTFCLISSDFEPYELVFQKYGRDGGGYDWEAVAIELMRLNHPGILKKLKFDSESSLFCAIGTRRDHLIKLQTLLQHIHKSKTPFQLHSVSTQQ